MDENDFPGSFQKFQERNRLERVLPKTIIIKEFDDTDFEAFKGVLDDKAERYIKYQASHSPLVFRNPFGNTAWLTNSGDDAEFLLSDLRRLNHGSYFYIGDPRASDVYSVEQLKDMGIVGIYEVQPAAKIADIWPLLKLENIG